MPMLEIKIVSKKMLFVYPDCEYVLQPS